MNAGKVVIKIKELCTRSIFRRNKAKKLNIVVIVLTGVFLSTSTFAINIAKTPLFLNNGAQPNIMFLLDDSGSMDWEILTVPHYEAFNYDRDANRSWARGGWLNSQHGNGSLAKRKAGDWVSYAGYCHDKNGDGICYNRLDLDGNGSDNNHEHGGTSQNVYVNGPLLSCVTTTHTAYDHTKKYRYRRYDAGSCDDIPCQTCGNGDTDASDYLPPVRNVALKQESLQTLLKTSDKSITANTWSDFIASLSGSTDLEAAVFCSTATDNRSDTSANWDHWADKRDPLNLLAQKAACELIPGKEWNWTTVSWQRDSSLDQVTHHNQEVTTQNTYQQVLDHTVTTGALDINGNDTLYASPNNATTDFDRSFHERDDWGVLRVNYEYLNEAIDNAYRNPEGPFGNTLKPWKACSQGDPAHYSSVSRCNKLIYADYSSTSNPSYEFQADVGQIAKKPTFGGNQSIVTLPNFVKRQIRGAGATYPWPSPPSTQVHFDTIQWEGGISPAGTHHAMSRWDNWPLISDWRIRSGDFNVLYYAPDTTYKPWPDLTQASFTAAHSNPQPGTAGYLAPTVNLSRPHITIPEKNIATVPYEHPTQAGFVYEIWHDDAGFWWDYPEWHNTKHCDTESWKASTYHNSKGRKVIGIVDPATGRVVQANDRVCSTYDDSPNGIIDLWDKHDRVEVYTDKIVVQTVRRTPHIFGEHINGDTSKRYPVSDTRVLNREIYTPANYASRSTDPFCIKVLGKDPSNPGHCRTLTQVQENVANWYEFSRRRSFVAKGAIAQILTDIPNLRYGLNVTSSSSGVSNLFKEMPTITAANYTAHNTDIRDTLYNYVWPAAGTPLRTALQRVGEYFKGNAPTPYNQSPIKESCQKNFAVLLTDGYWSGGPPTGIGDEDLDGYFNATSEATLADVAKKYYDDDLSSLADEVPPTSFDPNTQQHLTTIGIGFGVTGSLVDQNNNGWPGDVSGAGGSSLTEASNWGDPASNKQHKINDLWHAAYNSRGMYLNAKNPQELIDSLQNAILFATSTVGSASSLTVNQDFTSTGTRLYQTVFRSGEWSGDVRSLKRDASGDFASVDWSAQTKLSSVPHGNRKIFTLDASGANAVPFRYTSLSAPQQAAMKVRQVTGASDLDGNQHVNYIRGDSTNEGSIFRKRLGKKLGDIVHSAVLRVDVPRSSYPDNWGSGAPENSAPYSSFKALHNPPSPGTPRPVMLYAGANDGMLHAFDESGNEKYAYIPKVLIPKLNYLSHLPSAANPFKHQFYVDDTPVSSDAFFGGAWHTVLVGGLRGGGKAIYALDITTVPSGAASEATIGAAKHLWEFTDTNLAPYGDPDLGYTFSRPQIARLANNKWVAIFGNGYQDNATGKAILYVVDLSNGKLLRKIVADPTNVGNGLSSPTVIDVNNDYIADYVYAGDLKGNMWRFDLTDPLPANWGVSFSGSPLFVAHETGNPSSKQPITVAPAVEKHPQGLLAGYLVSFGTGKYIEPSDNNVAGEKTQTLYTIWDYDRNSTSAQAFDRSDLLIQSVLFQDASGARATSANGVNWMNSGHNIGEPNWKDNIDDAGWYIDLTFALNNEGERQVNPALLFGKFITFDTLIPSIDACSAGGGSRRYILDRESGANFLGEPQDLNNDGIIDPSEAAAFINAIYTKGYSYDDGNSQIPDLDTGEFQTVIDKSTGNPIAGQLPVITKGERKSWTQLD